MKDHESATGRISSVINTPKRDRDEKPSFYVDWRRFLLAATQSHLIFNPTAKPVRASLVAMANRLHELDQMDDKIQDNQPKSMLYIKVTRAQFQFIPFPWYPPNRQVGHTSMADNL